jgi:hypothetical protein
LNELPPLVVLGGSFCVGALAGWYLHFKGPAKWRSWAAPVAAVTVVLGIEHAFRIPDWISIPLYLSIPFLYHRTVRNKQLAAAEEFDFIEIGVGETLKRVKSPGGRILALWSNEPEDDENAVEEPIVFGLLFEGEGDDQYSVVLEAETTKARPGLLFAHHADGQVLHPAPLKELSNITGLPGQTPAIAMRSLPTEYAFEIFDLPTMSALGEIIELREDRREVALQLSGTKMRIESDGIFDAAELKMLIQRSAAIFTRLRGGGTTGNAEDPEAPTEPIFG